MLSYGVNQKSLILRGKQMHTYLSTVNFTADNVHIQINTVTDILIEFFQWQSDLPFKVVPRQCTQCLSYKRQSDRIGRLVGVT